MRRIGLAVMLGAALAAAPALAQKSKDTLRLPLSYPLPTVSAHFEINEELSRISAALFDTLVCYDRKQGIFVPLLASSWREIDDRTVEFKLRTDVAFHDGTKLTADDVVYTLTWASDPASKLRFSEVNFGWLERAEKIDEATVRVIARQATPLLMSRLAAVGEILPAKLLESYADKAEFARKSGVGTGPYKFVSLDAATGFVFARNADYRHGNPCKPAATIGTVRGIPMPDAQTRMAHLMTGGVDLIHVDSRDEPEMLAANPELRIAAIAGYGLQFLAIDAIGRSGNKPLADLKVRQAIAMALDRPALSRSVMPGAEAIRAVDALCTRDQLGCDFSTAPPAYDPAAGKRLLAEAGYPDGFEIELSARPGTWTLGEAMAGELRKIGIRVALDKLPTMAALRKKQADGKFGLQIGYWPPLVYADAASLVSYLFDDTPRSYWRDAAIDDLAAKGLSTEDPAQRKAAYRQLFDRVNQMSYVVPLALVPDVFVHQRDLAIDVDPVHGQGLALDDLRWN